MRVVLLVIKTKAICTIVPLRVSYIISDNMRVGLYYEQWFKPGSWYRIIYNSCYVNIYVKTVGNINFFFSLKKQ